MKTPLTRDRVPHSAGLSCRLEFPFSPPNGRDSFISALLGAGIAVDQRDGEWQAQFFALPELRKRPARYLTGEIYPCPDGSVDWSLSYLPMPDSPPPEYIIESSNSTGGVIQVLKKLAIILPSSVDAKFDLKMIFFGKGLGTSFVPNSGSRKRNLGGIVLEPDGVATSWRLHQNAPFEKLKISSMKPIDGNNLYRLDISGTKPISICESTFKELESETCSSFAPLFSFRKNGSVPDSVRAKKKRSAEQ